MTIDSLPTPPLRSDGPEVFADRGDTFLAALPTFVDQVNELEANVTGMRDSALASASSASASAAVASMAHYKGLWSALSGALSMPASVHHNGIFWALNVNLANVTAATPGVSASWVEISFSSGYATSLKFL